MTMHEPLLSWIERAAPALTMALTERLAGRAGGVIRGAGEAACQQVAAQVIAALASDLRAGKDSGTRTLMQALTQQFALAYADLRHLTLATRALVLASLAGESGVDDRGRQRAEEWLFQLVLVGAMNFVAHRERSFQEQAAQLEVRQLESQLDELKTALAEQTRLLDMIRQASTPIAPIYDGILVVPLVGVFDTQRAELLTDRLLHAVAEAHAKVVILDISGVPVFDTEAAQLIVRTSLAVRLLGTELILVGLSPVVAQTIVGLGVDLRDLKTLGSLQAGLAQALALRRRKIAKIA